MTKSKIPSVRAIEELKARYLSKIYDNEKTKRSKIESHVSAVHGQVAKASIRKYIDAIRRVDAPYKIVIKDTCKIKSTYSNKLTFELEFDPILHPYTYQDSISLTEIVSEHERDIKRLEAWYTKCLYLIAARNTNIPEFK